MSVNPAARGTRQPLPRRYGGRPGIHGRLRGAGGYQEESVGNGQNAILAHPVPASGSGPSISLPRRT